MVDKDNEIETKHMADIFKVATIEGLRNNHAIPYSFNSVQWRQMQLAPLIIAHIVLLRWYVIHAIKVECWLPRVNTAPITDLRAYVTAQT